MNGIIFYKMTGSGNDFVMLDGRRHRPEEWPPNRIAQVCDRRMGVGADGIVFLTPLGEGRVRMQYFNSDGSHASMCGNAALCSTRLAAYLELAPREGMVLETDAGEVRTRCAGDGHLAEILLPPFAIPERQALPLITGEVAAYFGVVGVPHLVVVTEDATQVDVLGRGKVLRYHPAFGSGGANVNFVSPAPGGASEPWVIRTYERGVEGETLACGTGTVAAAFAVLAANLRDLPSEWQTIRGIRLGVSGQRHAGTVTEAWLLGEGRMVFRGILNE